MFRGGKRKQAFANLGEHDNGAASRSDCLAKALDGRPMTALHRSTFKIGDGHSPPHFEQHFVWSSDPCP